MYSYAKYATIRDRQGLTDARVCKAIGIKPPVFSAWKSGRSTPKIDKIKKIAAYLNVSLDDLEKGVETEGYVSEELKESLKLMSGNADLRRLYQMATGMSRAHLKAMCYFAELLRGEENA